MCHRVEVYQNVLSNFNLQFRIFKFETGLNLYKRGFASSIFVMFDAILFDNDGVLVDTERRHVRACIELVQEMFGVEYTLEMYQNYGYTNGLGTTGWLRDQGISEEKILKFQELRNERYAQYLKDPIEPMKGVRGIIAFLEEKNIPRAVVTASPRLHFELAHSQTGLLEHFSFSICNKEVPRSKPHPDGYLAAAERLEVNPQACLVLEDSPRGVAAGKAAGMTVWAVPTDETRALDFSLADEVFESLDEVLSRLKMCC